MRYTDEIKILRNEMDFGKRKMNEKMGQSLLTVIANSEIPDVVSEVADGVIDIFSKSEVIDSLPIVGPIYKIGKSAINLKDYFFIRKLCALLTETKLSNEERPDHSKIDEMNENSLGERVLSAVEKSDDEKTARKIGKLFKAYLKSEIDLNDFLRLTKAFQNLIPADFRVLFLSPKEIQFEKEHVADSLFMSGLLELVLITGSANGNHNKYKVSKLGTKYLSIVEGKSSGYISETGDAFRSKYLLK